MTQPQKYVALKLAALAIVAAVAGMPGAQAQVKGNFDEADVNHDGHVTLQEYEAYITNRLMNANGRRAQRFQQMTPQERDAALQRRFERLDRGHKGYLDRDDWNSQ